ncbi:unnamed protein product, partial [Nesidiocoris tenuis]
MFQFPQFAVNLLFNPDFHNTQYPRYEALKIEQRILDQLATNQPSISRSNLHFVLIGLGGSTGRASPDAWEWP